MIMWWLNGSSRIGWARGSKIRLSQISFPRIQPLRLSHPNEVGCGHCTIPSHPSIHSQPRLFPSDTHTLNSIGYPQEAGWLLIISVLPATQRSSLTHMQGTHQQTSQAKARQGRGGLNRHSNLMHVINHKRYQSCLLCLLQEDVNLLSTQPSCYCNKERAVYSSGWVKKPV